LEKGTRPRDSVKALVDRHSDLLRYLSLRLPNTEDAREMAQEAYLRLLRLDDDHFIRFPEAYLFRIAANLIHEHWLSSKTGSKSADVEPDNLPSPSDNPETMASQQEAMLELERAVDLLPPIQQTIVIQHRRDGRTYDEIAADLGISRDMVKKHLMQGLVRCRQYLKLNKHE